MLKTAGIVSFLSLFSFTDLFSQCLTEFEKLLPEPSLDYNQAFGEAISMDNEVMAVGAPNSDSLGRITGIVYLYGKENAEWVLIGILKPSEPVDALQFGANVKVQGEYILVGAKLNGGQVYVFRKPSTGWGTTTEVAVLSTSNSYTFGTSYWNKSISITEDYNTIIVTDQYYWNNSSSDGSGKVVIYTKEPYDEWVSTSNGVILQKPANLYTGDFGIAVETYKDRIAIMSRTVEGYSGGIHVYKKGAANNYELETTLLPEDPTTQYIGFANFIFNEKGIYTTASYFWGANTENLFYFELNSTNSWTGTTPTSIFPLSSYIRSNESQIFFFKISSATNGIYLSVLEYNNKNAVLLELKSQASQFEVTRIKEYEFNSLYVANFFGWALESNPARDLTVARVSHPQNENLPIAIECYLRNQDQTFTAQKVSLSKKSTQGSRYGASVHVLGNYMLVGSPYDGTVKPLAGCVYGYKKSGDTWVIDSKILPPIGDRHDNVFGTSLASNETQVAVGAPGHGNYGKVFIYKKKSSWGDLELNQILEIPLSYSPYASGNNLKMTNTWLAVPCVTNLSSARVNIAMYKFQNNNWELKQFIEVGVANIFAKESTPKVDIYLNTMAVGGRIFELKNDEWQLVAQLSPSDPEYMQIDPTFTYWITNGDSFGTSVDIFENTIFISAPTKDNEGIWDVGAVYVYIKKPNESWTSRAENAKILPRIREERELFGWSVQSVENTLLVGAPGADYKKDGTARNKPGRAYMFQSQDYYWQNVTSLVDFTGDTFVKDYFGINIDIDQSDFIVSAIIEDTPTGKLAGSVYLTETPPLIKLIPPVCGENTINLFGYPFGGTWSGPGIVDEIQGIFDPKIAGVNTHQLIYTTPSCANPGILQIEVYNGAEAKTIGSLDKVVCEVGTTQTTLSIEPVSNATYQWEFKKLLEQEFLPISGTQASLTVSNTGYYRAKLNNGICNSYSDEFSVTKEANPITIDNIPAVCTSEPTTLVATPTPGTWYGSYVTGNIFNSQSVTNGNYAVSYKVTSSAGCQHQKNTSVIVAKIPQLNYSRSSSNLCDEGEIELSLTGLLENDLTFDWLKESESISVSSSPKIQISSNGTYQAVVKNNYCEKLHEPFTINDSFEIDITPSNNSVFCIDEVIVINTNAQDDDNLNWLYKEGDEDDALLLPNNEPQFPLNKSGFYKLKATRNSCEFESEFIRITILPADSVFVPNVFTPNHDGLNEVFSVQGNVDYKTLTIVDRNGKTVFSGNPFKGWRGDGCPAGVYYWLITYNDCYSRLRSVKGYVHLIK